MFNFAVMSFFRLLGIHGHPAGVGGAGDEALVRVLPVQVGAADRAGVGVRPVDVAAITIGTAGRKNGAQRTARPSNLAAVGRLDDIPTTNPRLAGTILCEPDSSGCSWFSLPVRDDRAGGDRKNRVANPRHVFRRRTSSNS